MVRLSVNVNKVATLRNARGGDTPNLVKVAQDCENFGAQGITVHPRPDERHITGQDVEDLYKVVTTEFNIEGYPDERFFSLLELARPAQATLVPDPPDVLTSNAGWDAKGRQQELAEAVSRVKEMGIRCSIFMETDADQLEWAQRSGTDRVELYTGPYAEMYAQDREKAVEPYTRASEVTAQLGMGLNAGHDLNLDNLEFFKDRTTGLLEVSIGHALISDALYYGLENTIRMYRARLR